MSEIDELKKLLADAASEKTTDFNKILALANTLAKQDSENVRFSVDASHISRLGLELVSKQETAVAELIKNAYDAEASSVDLIFKDSSAKGGILEIIDNGLGMSRNQLLDGFMRISTQDKVLSPTSSKFKRQKAGRKGIGRFATQRLGRKLVITTQLEAAKDSLRLEIDWDLFEGGKDLYLVSNQIVVVPKLPSAGTTLRIESLRDPWSDAQIQRAFRYIAELLQPFPLNEKGPKKTAEDPGFKVAFFQELEGDIKTIADEEQSIYAHAYAQFSGRVTENGEALVSIDSTKYSIKIPDRPLAIEPKLKPKTGLKLESYPLLHDVNFKAYYFIQDELPAGTRAMVRDILNRQGGIRVYRNGFRVLPYGESFDDWLGLQRSSALREVLPPHHNHNFLGFVEIVDVEGARFEETASREGLLENEAFMQLQDFVYRALMAGVIELAHARGKKVFATDEKKKKSGDKNKEGEKSPQEEATELADQLRAAAAASNESDSDLGEQNPKPATSKSLGVIADAVEKIGAKSQAIFEENGMLRVLASLGLTIGEFTHEVRHALAALNAILSTIEKEGVAAKTITDAKNNMVLLQSYVRYFDNAVTQNAHRRLDVHELRDLIHEFSEVVRPTLTRQNVVLTHQFEGYDLFTKPMHKSEWSSALLNLFTNSLKAIQRAGTKGKIHIAGGSVDKLLYIEFSDNGDGIPPDRADRIFDAFYTTSSPPGALASDTEKLVGTGLGLKIVRDIIEAANGEIFVSEPPGGYSTCLRIELPRATDEEIGDARY
jgi:signal transduction histidine kinase